MKGTAPNAEKPDERYDYGTFAKQKVYGEGTYTFTVTEIVPEEGDDDYNPAIDYDDVVTKTVTVTVTWYGEDDLDEDHPTVGLYAEYAYPAEPNSITVEDGNKAVTYVLFTNTYDADGEWAPNVFKTLKGRDWAEGETFYFEVIDNDNDDTVVLEGTATIENGEAVVVWTSTADDTKSVVEYTLADLGEHNYTIHEVYTAQDDENNNGST